VLLWRWRGPVLLRGWRGSPLLGRRRRVIPLRRRRIGVPLIGLRWRCPTLLRIDKSSLGLLSRSEKGSGIGSEFLSLLATVLSLRNHFSCQVSLTEVTDLVTGSLVGQLLRSNSSRHIIPRWSWRHTHRWLHIGSRHIPMFVQAVRRGNNWSLVAILLVNRSRFPVVLLPFQLFIN